MSLTASFASTVGEELIVLLRALHSLPVWNAPINTYIGVQLRRVVAMVKDKPDEVSGDRHPYFDVIKQDEIKLANIEFLDRDNNSIQFPLYFIV